MQPNNEIDTYVKLRPAEANQINGINIPGSVKREHRCYISSKENIPAPGIHELHNNF